MNLPKTVWESKRLLTRVENHIKRLEKARTKAKVTSLSQLNKAANTHFASLTPAQQRIAIAKDVIASVRSGQYEASPGTYFSTFGIPDDAVGKELQTFLKKGVECNVCVLGACFASKVKIANNYKLRSHADFRGEVDFDRINDEARFKLGSVFPVRHRDLMESAFEQSDMHESDDSADYDRIQEAIEFGNRYADPAERMIAIMTNIIHNGGTFEPNEAKDKTPWHKVSVKVQPDTKAKSKIHSC